MQAKAWILSAVSEEPPLKGFKIIGVALHADL